MPPDFMSAPMSEEEMMQAEMPEEGMEEEMDDDLQSDGAIADMTLGDIALKIKDGSMSIDEVMQFLQPQEMPAPEAEDMAMGGPEEMM